MGVRARAKVLDWCVRVTWRMEEHEVMFSLDYIVVAMESEF